MEKQIAIIDYGASNLHSVYKAFKYMGANIEVTKDLKTIEKSDALVFPGVGAFGSTMNSIRKNKLENIIIQYLTSTRPFLGICMGMQVLFEEGEEEPLVKGLSVFKGQVVKFKKVKKIPHIGWNEVICYSSAVLSMTLQNKFYFVHSYHVVPENKSIIYGETEYDGEKFVSVIKKDNLLAVQFHPEKSGEAGLDLIQSFVKMI